MKRTLIYILIALALIMATIGAYRYSRITKADAMENSNRFRVEAGGTNVGVSLVTDRDTGVQYLVNEHSGEMIMLVDKDGNPYIANGWRDYGGED